MDRQWNNLIPKSLNNLAFQKRQDVIRITLVKPKPNFCSFRRGSVVQNTLLRYTGFLLTSVRKLTAYKSNQTQVICCEAENVIVCSVFVYNPSQVVRD